MKELKGPLPALCCQLLAILMLAAGVQVGHVASGCVWALLLSLAGMWALT